MLGDESKHSCPSLILAVMLVRCQGETQRVLTYALVVKDVLTSTWQWHYDNASTDFTYNDNTYNT